MMEALNNLYHKIYTAYNIIIMREFSENDTYNTEYLKMFRIFSVHNILFSYPINK